jgi:hypothetical protein
MFKKLLIAAAATGLIAIAVPLEASAAKATKSGQLTCRDVAKLKYPTDRKMRVAYKRGCKKAHKLNPQPLPPKKDT